MMDSAIDSGSSVLDRLSASSRGQLMALAQEQVFNRGVTLLREGHETPFLGLVEAGRVALRLRVPEQGEPATIATVEPGELLGWSAVVPPFRATVDAVATEPVTLLVFESGVLREQLGRDRDFAAEVLPLVLETVSARLGESWHQLLDMFATRAPQPW
jgi:CRP/FNR family transcriptional regulator, cyclic AMP receptor protein